MCWLKNETQTPRGQCVHIRAVLDWDSCRVKLRPAQLESVPWLLSCGGFTHKQINMQSWNRVWGQRFGKKECLCGKLRDAAETSRQRGTEETLEEHWDLRTRHLWRLFIVEDRGDEKAQFCSQPAGFKVDLLWLRQLPLLLLASCVEITHHWHVLHCCWLD